MFAEISSQRNWQFVPVALQIILKICVNLQKIAFCPANLFMSVPDYHIIHTVLLKAHPSQTVLMHQEVGLFVFFITKE